MTAPQGQQYITYVSQPPEEMTYEEYVAAVAAVTAALAGTVLAISFPFQALALTRVDWLSFLAATYPYVEQARQDVSELSRKFYDSERAKHVPPIELPIFDVFDQILGPDGRPIRIEDNSGITGTFHERLNINVAPYHPDWYEEAMDAVVDLLMKPNTTDGELVQVTAQAMKEAENGGRRTILYAVPDDPADVRWARVQGGEDSCGFCAMLISRGPVYATKERAGWNPEGIPEELMTRWHPNCDCKVVPVFDTKRWPGRDEYLRLEKLWVKITKPYASYETLPNGKQTMPKLNAFRRYIENGTLPSHLTASDLRGLQAA